MNEEEVRKELQKIERIKNITTSYNESKDIFDIYARILGDEENTKDILNNIEDLDYQYCSFGVFEFWFNTDKAAKVVEKLQNNL